MVKITKHPGVLKNSFDTWSWALDRILIGSFWRQLGNHEKNPSKGRDLITNSNHTFPSPPEIRTKKKPGC